MLYYVCTFTIVYQLYSLLLLFSAPAASLQPSTSSSPEASLQPSIPSPEAFIEATIPSPEAFVEATWTASPWHSLPAAFNPSTPPASRIPPSPLSHTGKKRKRKGEQDDLNGKIAELQERRQALLSPEGQDKYYRFGQMMEELARTAVAEKQHSAMVKAMSFLLSVQGVDDLYDH